ncbi:MAG: cysteine synthase A [Sulfobacillus thermotolerans]|uniref:Cysteine synthase n=1 Tax=Sulfobacillus thermotolerans TaxID=338644 RepID=A0ABM6RS21_9FIRM|nr:cysteine synthase A [Sulfobacillus thermotolerans]MCY0907728.1 cysteine synthase A [Sulfobacillus thermotolerans]
MADLSSLIGHTPMVLLDSLAPRAQVFAKLESFNPGGSIKDRTAWSLLKDAMDRGKVGPKTVIIEATSGNTGIALAMVCALNHLRLVVFMPEGQSSERKQLFWAYGATIIETPREEKTAGAIRRAKALEASLPDALMLRQHENPANPSIHEMTTGPEIWEQMGQRVDVLVAGVGTGGTITGTGKFLKRVNPDIEIVAVEPENSAVMNGKPAGNHRIQGIGAGFIPQVLDMSVVTKVVDVPDEGAIQATQLLAREEGLVVGLSSGAAYWAVQHLLDTGDYDGKHIAVIFPDSGERYLSTGLYPPTSSEWLKMAEKE